MKNQSIEIRVAGQRFALKNSNSDSEHVQQVLALVTRKLKEVETRSPAGAAPYQILLLALVDVAEEYIKSKKSTIEYRNQLEEKSHHLFSLIESELK